MRYEMAKQTCLCCGTPVPFIPFKDPVCEPCSQPVSIVADELPNPALQAKANQELNSWTR